MTSQNKVSPEAQPVQSLDQNPPKPPISRSAQSNTDASKLTNAQAKKDTGKEPSKKSSNTEKEKRKDLHEADQHESEYVTFNPCLTCRGKIQLRTWCTVIGAIEIVMCVWIVILLLILRSFVLTSYTPPQVYSEESEFRQSNTFTRNKTKEYYRPGKENDNKNPVSRFFQKHDAFNLNRFQSKSRSGNNNENSSTKFTHDDEFLPMFYITFGGLWFLSLITGIFMFFAAARRSKVFCILHSVAAFLSAGVSLYLCVLLIMSVKIAAWPFVLIFGIAFVCYVYFLTCSVGLYFQIRAGLYDDEFQPEEDIVVPTDQLERDSQGNLRRKSPSTKNLTKPQSGNDTGERNTIKDKDEGKNTKNFFSRHWGTIKQNFQKTKKVQKPVKAKKNKNINKINKNKSEWAQQRAPSSKLPKSPQNSGPTKSNTSNVKPPDHVHAHAHANANAIQGKEIDTSKKPDHDNQQIKPAIPNEIKKNEPEHNVKSITEQERRQSEDSKQSKGNKSKDTESGGSHSDSSDEKEKN